MQTEIQSNIVSIPEIISFIKQKDYKFVKRLGNGSFGITILVKDETINETFVCKKYQPQFGIDKEKYYKNFLNEIKILHKLNHNNIVRVFNYYMYESNYTGYVLMEYINGININEFIKNNPETINDIFEQTINGFAYLEEQQILHRDIRPTNILIDNDGFVKIIDFGFGKQILNSEDFDRSFSSLNWWCALPMDFQTCTYDYTTEIYFIGKLFEKLIIDYDISTFSYNSILANMCELDPNKRIQTFDSIKRAIINKENFEDLFSNDEKNFYKNFADALCNVISCIYENANYYNDIDLIQKKLTDLYRNVMLEDIVPDNTKIIQCFVDGAYKYWKDTPFQVLTFNSFLKFLKICTKEKKNIVLNNLHSRLDSITRVNNELMNEDEVPF